MKHYEKQFMKRVLSPNDKFDSFSINVHRYFTTVDGTLIDKNDVPVQLKKKYPIYLFSGFDRDGGYKISAGEAPALDGYSFVRMFVKNDAYDFTAFSGLNNVEQYINTGDLVFLYTDDILNPTYFVWLVQSVTNRALGSIISNIPTEGFNLKEFSIFSDNEKVYNEMIGIINTDLLGVYNYNQISPLAFKTPDYQQSKMVKIPYETALNSCVGFVSYFPFLTDRIEYDFKFLNIPNNK